MNKDTKGWREEFDEQYTSMAYGEKWRPGMELTPSMIKAFISTQFEKLIDQIKREDFWNIPREEFEVKVQQLRKDWQ